MLLRDFLNEFELDWAQAAVRSELIPPKKLKGAKILLAGSQPDLQESIAWSFMAWNDEKKLGVRAVEGELSAADGEEGRIAVTHLFTEQSFAAAEADYVILTGLCCCEIPGTVLECMEYLEQFGRLVEAACRVNCKRILLLSDGRVYGRVRGDGAAEFMMSEYESGTAAVPDGGFSAQYLLQAMEGILVSAAKAAGRACNILRTARIYGPCIPMQNHTARRLAEKTASGSEIELQLLPDRDSYVCIHDVLTALQFVLTVCPENKIFNVKGPDSDKSAAELAVMLYQNFPAQCKLRMAAGGGKLSGADRQGAGVDDNFGLSAQPGILLNTQLIEHYGFVPSVSMEDGLIILVKCLQNTGEVFIFDNTYLGKLEKVQKILLGYLLEIDRICRKYDIKYFLAGGTLLGAIRHHGFIPWDDDADVMMLREDYDRFQAVVQKELPDNIFMQLPTTEKGNHNPFTKLRINNTMFATEFTGHFMELHNGIFFDVLSHDRTGNHKWSQKLHLMVTMLTRSVVFNKWGNTDIKSGGNHPVICKIVDKAKYLVPMRFAEWAQNKSLTFFKKRRTEYLYDGMGRNLKRGPFPKAWLDEAVYVEFEGYAFPVPKEYDKYLTYLYGDYMQMIPVSHRRTSHSIVLTDLGAYTEFRLAEDAETESGIGEI